MGARDGLRIIATLIGGGFLVYAALAVVRSFEGRSMTWRTGASTGVRDRDVLAVGGWYDAPRVVDPRCGLGVGDGQGCRLALWPAEEGSITGAA
jgi:hypothetical protein